MPISAKFYAHNGIDAQIRMKYFPNVETGVVIEVGAGKPTWASQSKHFEESGWRRICVDPNPFFVDLHRKAGTEIYEFACADYDADDVIFQLVGKPEFPDETAFDMEGFSSLKVRDDYAKATGYSSVSQLPITEIKVKVRKLDTIIAPLNLPQIDYVSVDTEGWEVQVMKGFDIERWKPKVILLEDSHLNGDAYKIYMETRGYVRDLRVNDDQCYVPKS